MCEFCIQHGEGKKWYLEMKNYSNILFNEALSSTQKEIAGVNSRAEYIERSFVDWIMPAMGITVKDAQVPLDAVESHEDTIDDNQDPSIKDVDQSEKTKADLANDEIVARSKIVHFGQVIPIEDVDATVDLASSITRLPCGCRYISTGKTDKRYCFGLGIDKAGILGKYPDESASLEVLDKEAAKEILHKYDDEGLMHTIWTGITLYVEAICNCDRDCLAYNSSYVEGYPSGFFRGEYICQVDWDQCTGCKECVSQCQFGALHYSSTLSKVYIHPTMCFGCGVCRAVCSNVAISLQPRVEHEIAQNYWLANEL